MRASPLGGFAARNALEEGSCRPVQSAKIPEGGGFGALGAMPWGHHES